MEAREYSSLLDEVQGEQREGFVVDNDSAADWCLRLKRQVQQEIGRYDLMLCNEIDDLKARHADRVKPLEERIVWLDGLLAQYMRTLDIKPTKAGARKYKLLNGTLMIKPQEPQYNPDNEKLVSWLIHAGRADLVKITHAPMWGELKKEGVRVLDDGTVCTADGEIIDGMTAIMRPDKFTAEVD